MSFALALIMVVNCIIITKETKAADSVLELTADSVPQSGDTYGISSYEQLVYLANVVNGGNPCSGVTFVLTEDITMPVGKTWKVIGNSDNPFSGTFDGNSHKVDNFYIYLSKNHPVLSSSSSTLSYYGFFGYLKNATVKNLQITNALITGDASIPSYNRTYRKYQYLAVLAGYVVSSTIENCYVGGEMNVENFYQTSTTKCVGGLTGYVTSSYDSTTKTVTASNIKNCTNNVKFSMGKRTEKLGGIAAYCYGSVNIYKCLNKSEIVGGASEINEETGTGGIVGRVGPTSGAQSKYMADENYRCHIFNCVNHGKVWACDENGNTLTTTKSRSRRGGIVGYAGNTYGVFVENCFNSGKVSNGHYYSSNAYFSASIVGSVYGISVSRSFICISNSYFVHNYVEGEEDDIYLHSCKIYTAQGGVNIVQNRNNYFIESVYPFYCAGCSPEEKLNSDEFLNHMNKYAKYNSTLNVVRYESGTYAGYASVDSTVTCDESQEREGEEAVWIIDPTLGSNGLPTIDLDYLGYGNVEVTYTVTYKDGLEGSLFADEIIGGLHDGDNTPLYSVPERTGYDFAGWESDWQNTVSNNIVYTAKWTPKVYNAKFETGGLVNINSQNVNFGDIVEKPADPVIKGYKFSGWYMDSAFETLYDFSTIVNENVTLYGKFDLVEADIEDSTKYDEDSDTENPTKDNNEDNNTKNPTKDNDTDNNADNLQKDDSTDTPKTGDKSAVLFLIITMLASTIGIVYSIKKYIRVKN